LTILRERGKVGMLMRKVRYDFGKAVQEGFVGKYQGTQLDGLSAGDTIRVNGYFPCLTEFI
jgi:hypothetical protein